MVMMGTTHQEVPPKRDLFSNHSDWTFSTSVSGDTFLLCFKKEKEEVSRGKSVGSGRRQTLQDVWEANAHENRGVSHQI